MPNISDILAAVLPEFGKAVFSQPTDKAAAQKLSVRPLVIRGETVYQAESAATRPCTKTSALKSLPRSAAASLKAATGKCL